MINEAMETCPLFEEDVGENPRKERSVMRVCSRRTSRYMTQMP